MSLKALEFSPQFTLCFGSKSRLIRTSQCLQRQCATTAVMKSSFSTQNLDLHSFASFRSNKAMRRFSDEQIKSLEVMFEADSRPESRRKQQLATELGLRPRQVAVWFQNRRARLKSKQIERDYRLLKAGYDTLASSFELLKREHQSLLLQSQKLKTLLGKHQGVERGNGSDDKSVKSEPTSESKETPTVLPETEYRQNNTLTICGKCGDTDCTVVETSTMNTEEPTVVSPRSSEEDWSCFERSSFHDELSGNPQWWELLS